MPRIQFKGKDSIVNYHLTVPYHQFQAVEKKSMLEKGKNPSLHDNMIIHGDNLTALKALLPTHGGKVNCIYIDPPYNTGNEGWVYNDNVNNAMMRQWFGKEVDHEDMTRHDKWLCMMWPRLSLLRELLAEDGVIFVSIDDNEQHRLRMVMDEVFGEGNFRNEIAVRRYNKNISRQFIEKGMKSLTIGFERIVVYSKSSLSFLNPVYRETTEERGQFGYWKGFWNAAPRPTMRYKLLGVTPEDGQWKWKKSVAMEAVENYQEYLDNHSHISLEEYWMNTGETKKFIRRRKDLTRGKNKGVEHWIPPSEGVLLSSDWTDLLASDKDNSISGISFDAPKNTNFIQRLIETATSNRPDAIVLDSFAGSGTTAHAVLALNKEDGGNRKFILVECEDYADKITAERVRRVIKGVTKSKDENLKEGLGGNFGYWELGGPMEMQSILEGDNLPTYNELARYVFYTATGEQWSPKLMKKGSFFAGESEHYQVYLFYKPSIKYLRETSLTLKLAESLPKPGDKWRLVFAPTRYANPNELSRLKIKFSQLPFEIYRMAK